MQHCVLYWVPWCWLCWCRALLGSPACNTDQALYTNTRSLKRLVINEGNWLELHLQARFISGHPRIRRNSICILNSLQLSADGFPFSGSNKLFSWIHFVLKFLKESAILTSVSRINVCSVLCHIFTWNHTPLSEETFPKARKSEPVKVLLSSITVRAPQDLH